MSDFKINFLDHVAIRVKDIDLATAWYEKVLGLKKYEVDAWGPYPIFMLAGRTGVALFPANTNDPKLEARSKNVKIDHFAFNVTQEDFKRAQQKYDRLGLKYSIQDHVCFHSMYTEDPDGHMVELTTLVADELSFYGPL